MRAALSSSGPDRVQQRLRAATGPLLIIALVLVMRRDIAFHHALPTSDLTRLWLPTYDFLGRQLSAGHIPGWDPNLFAGRAFTADPQSGWMYAPPMGLFAVLDAGWAMRVMVLMQPMLAGVGLYGFLRAERFDRVAATLAGIGVAGVLCGSQLIAALPFAAVFAWNAVTLWALARAFLARRAWAAGLWLALAAASTGQAAAAHLSTGLAMHLMLVGGYLALQIARRHRRGSAAAAAAAYLALAVGLAAAYLLPRVAQLPDTSLADGYAAAWNLARSLADAAPAPPPIGQRAASSWPLTLAAAPGPHLPALLLCALPVALLGLRSGRRRGLVAVLATVGAAGYLLSLAAVADAVPSSWRSLRPIDLYLHGPSWFADVTLLCIVLLGAIGVERLLAAGRLRRGAIVAAATVTIAAAAWAAGCSPSQLVLFAVSGAACAVALAIPRGGSLAMIAIVTAELVIGTIVGVAPSALTRALPRKLQRADAARPYLAPQPNGATARMLRGGGGRVLFAWHRRSLTMEVATGLPSPLDGSLNGPLMDGVPTVGGYDAVQPRLFWAYTRTLVRPPLEYNRTLIDRPTPAALDLLDVGWMVLPLGERPPVAATVRLSGSGYVLWKLRARPIAQLYPSWSGASSAAAARRLATGPGFDPARRLVVALAPDGLAPGATAGTVRVLEQGAQRLVFTTTADAAEMLLVRQSYDPFWRATVDGRPIAVRVGDGFEPALLVPAGRHRVVLTYDDPWIVRGLVVSAFTLAAWLAACVAIGRRPSPLDVRERPV